MKGPLPGSRVDDDDVCLSGIRNLLNDPYRSRSNAVVGACLDPSMTAGQGSGTKQRSAPECSPTSAYPFGLDRRSNGAQELPIDEDYQHHLAVSAVALSSHVRSKGGCGDHNGEGSVTRAKTITGRYSIPQSRRGWRPYATTLLVLATSLLGVSLLCTILNSSWTRQVEDKTCQMSFMRPSYIHLREFGTEHTRFATKYSLYLYREQGIDHEHEVLSPQSIH